MGPPRHTNKSTRATSNQQQQRYGNNLDTSAGRSVTWARGYVVTSDVATGVHKLNVDGVGGVQDARRVLRDPGDTSILPDGTVVIVHNALGYWLIDGIIKEPEIVPTTLPPPTVTEVRGVGGEDPVNAMGSGGPFMRSSDTPTDVLPGDYVRQSPDKNMIGVLAGGTNIMQSSPFAAVRTHALDDMVEVFAHKYRHLSAMGNLDIKSEDGKTSLVWRAGSDQSEENGPDRENWTIRMDVGASGDLFDFAITRPDGNILSRIHMSATGRIQIMGVDGVDIISGGDTKTVNKEVVLSNKEVTYDGNLAQSVAQDHTTVIDGSRQTQVSGNDGRITGGDFNDTVGKDWNHTVNGKVKQRVIGGTIPVPGATAYELEVINGGIVYRLGNLQNMNVVAGVAGSGVNFDMGVLGSFNVVSALPQSVKLGATGAAITLPDGSVQVTAVAPFAATLFEPLLAAMTALMTAFDTHTHLTPVGPTVPPPIPIMTPLVTPLLQLARSQRVAIGL